MATTSPVDTGRVTDRRSLHFNNLDEVLTDVNQLAEADRAGKLRCVGNWTLGQNLGHLGSWINYSFDGVPIKVPWFVKLIMRPMKNSTLHKPMTAGRNIPRVRGGTLGTDRLTTDEGVTQFTRALARLKAAAPSLPHVLFGKMTHEEWIDQHLRHAELHLSFCRAD